VVARVFISHASEDRTLAGELHEWLVRELAGVGVNDDLVTQLIEDTGSGEALPLLAFTAGCGVALTHQADEARTEAVTAGAWSREQIISGHAPTRRRAASHPVHPTLYGGS
jgi:hypothetical protein